MLKLVDSNANVASSSISIKVKNQAGLFQNPRYDGSTIKSKKRTSKTESLIRNICQVLNISDSFWKNSTIGDKQVTSCSTSANVDAQKYASLFTCNAQVTPSSDLTFSAIKKDVSYYAKVTAKKQGYTDSSTAKTTTKTVTISCPKC